jgi:hypothetical protein
LIDEIDGLDFVPAVLVNGDLTKKIDDPNKERVYLELSEKQGLLQMLHDQVVVHYSTYDNQLKEKDKIKESTFFIPDEKAIFLTQCDEFINNLVTTINQADQWKQRLEEEISTLALLISEYGKIEKINL